jgi:peptidoglycan/LPS O-acetylase OafA/YrhL
MIKYIKSLDGVRGIAALMVIVYHYFNVNKFNGIGFSQIHKFVVIGQTGVSLFFVLSGFLITRILLRTKEKRNYFQKFYIKRALRIFPLYYLFLLIFYFIDPIIRSQQILPTGIAFWLYLQDIYMTFHFPKNGPDHFWSLAVEEHFYLFWPFIIYYLKDIDIFKVSIVLILFSFVLRYILFSNGYEVFYFTFTRIDELVLGAFLAILEIKNKLTIQSIKIYKNLFVVLVLANGALWVFLDSTTSILIQVIKFPLIGMLYFSALAILICLAENHFLSKILSSRPLLYTGKISYGMYVFHPMIFLYLDSYQYSINILWKFFIAIILIYIVSSICFFLFEKRFLDLKGKYTHS